MSSLRLATAARRTCLSAVKGSSTSFQTRQFRVATAAIRGITGGGLTVNRSLSDGPPKELTEEEYLARSLLIAAKDGDKAIVLRLLERGVDINFMNDDGRSALHRAAENGGVEVLTILLDKGANINATDEENSTPLSVAATRGHLDAVSLLLDRGSNIEFADEDGRTALFLASGWGYLEIVKRLLDRGCNIEASDDTGATPLIIAATRGNVNVVRLLLDRGSDIDAADKSGKTALASAEKSSVKQLLTNAPAVRAAAAAAAAAVKVYHSEALVAAAEKGNEKMVRLLLCKGANIYYVNQNGETALLTAIKNDHSAIAELLVSKSSADVVNTY